MPNIRSQRIDADGVEIVASDGRVFRLRPDQVKAAYDTATGRDTAERTAKTGETLAAAVVAALGPEQIRLDDVAVEFEAATGRVRDARWESGSRLERDGGGLTDGR